MMNKRLPRPVGVVLSQRRGLRDLQRLRRNLANVDALLDRCHYVIFTRICENFGTMLCHLSVEHVQYIIGILLSIGRIYFEFKGLGSMLKFHSNFESSFCKQTVTTLIRLRILRCLTWVCNVCLCPTNRTLDLYGLRTTLLLCFSAHDTCK